MNKSRSEPESVLSSARPGDRVHKKFYRLRPRGQILDFKSLNDLVDEARRLSTQIPSQVEAIVGIPRSGMIPAYTIALAAGGLPIWSLPDFLDNRPLAAGSNRNQNLLPQFPSEVKTIVLVDDVVGSGRAMQKALSSLADSWLTHTYTCAPYAYHESADLIDIVGSTIDPHSLYEWNFTSHISLEDCCVDIDGLLCFDPSLDQDDDSNKYMEFLRSARPRYKLSRPVRAVVSARLEKYRDVTEEWLRQNGISYGQLYLLDAPDADVRRRFELQAPFKASVYRQSNAALFIESELWQARAIATLSRMSVLCTDVMTLVRPEVSVRSPFWIRKISKRIIRQMRLGPKP